MKKLVRGHFVQEESNRFRCLVDVDGTIMQCYVASSCKLSHFLNLQGKEVLLEENTNMRAKSRFSLLAVKFKRSYILLNSSYANRAVFRSLPTRKFSFLGKRDTAKRESVIGNYKADISISDSRTIIEIKSVLSCEQDAPFGSVHSDRLIQQLTKIYQLLSEGYNVYLFAVSLNPYTKRISFSREADYYSILTQCIEKGLILKCYAARLDAEGNSYIANKVLINGL